MTATGIMIDSREPEWVQKLKFGGIPTAVTMLESGDCMIATDDGQLVLVERKTPDDYLGSLRDERLFPQMTNMLDVTRWAYLVITGDFGRGKNNQVITERETGWNWNAVQGSILSIQELGVFVTYCGGDQDYEATVLRIAGREHKKDLLIAPPRMPRILSAQEAFIAALPGIGMERLRIVLDYCGTPGWALVALTDNTTKLPGIPSNVKRMIRATLGLQDEYQMGILTDESGAEVMQILKLGEQ